MTKQQIIKLLDSWNTPEETERLNEILREIVRDNPIEGNEKFFKYNDICCIFDAARDYALELKWEKRENELEWEKERKYYQECYDQAISEGKTPEEATEFANDMMKQYSWHRIFEHD